MTRTLTPDHSAGGGAAVPLTISSSTYPPRRQLAPAVVVTPQVTAGALAGTRSGGAPTVAAGGDPFAWVPPAAGGEQRERIRPRTAQVRLPTAKTVALQPLFCNACTAGEHAQACTYVPQMHLIITNAPHNKQVPTKGPASLPLEACDSLGDYESLPDRLGQLAAAQVRFLCRQLLFGITISVCVHLNAS